MATERELLSFELVQDVESIADAFAARSIHHALVGGLATALVDRRTRVTPSRSKPKKKTHRKP